MKSKNLHILLRAWWPTIAWAALLFVASSIPGTSYPSVDVPLADKVVHFGLYGVLAALATRGLVRGHGLGAGRAFLGAVALASLYGASDELHQLFVPNRSADLLDLLADAVGGSAGAALYLGARRWRGD